MTYGLTDMLQLIVPHLYWFHTSELGEHHGFMGSLLQPQHCIPRLSQGAWVFILEFWPMSGYV